MQFTSYVSAVFIRMKLRNSLPWHASIFKNFELRMGVYRGISQKQFFKCCKYLTILYLQKSYSSFKNRLLPTRMLRDVSFLDVLISKVKWIFMDHGVINQSNLLF